jgi:pimeloyl-ACP methyl ester carboxylesterase
MKEQIAGVSTEYQRIGKGPVLFFLHGWRCDWQIWSPLIQPLSQKYQLILVDLPAFGKSQEPAAVWNTSDFAVWLDEAIKTLSPNSPITLIGHSFGGKVAVQYLYQFPQNAVQQLVLFDSAGIPAPLSSQQQLQQIVFSFIPSFMKKAFGQRMKRKLLQRIGSATDHLDSTPLQRAILRRTIRESVATFLPQISLPTLVIWGKDDVDTPIDQARQFAALLPAAQLELLDNAGHFSFVDQTAQVLELLEEFLRTP